MSPSVWRYQIYYVCAANPQFLIHWYKLSLVSFFCKINNPSLDNSFGSKIIFALGEIWSSCLPFRLLIQTGRKRKNQMVNLTLIIKYIFSHFSFLEPIVPCMQLLFGSSNLYSHRPSVAFHYFGWLPNSLTNGSCLRLAHFTYELAKAKAITQTGGWLPGGSWEFQTVMRY